MELHQRAEPLTFIFLRACWAAEREDLFTGLASSSGCWETGGGVMKGLHKWMYADVLVFRSTFIKLGDWLGA